MVPDLYRADNLRCLFSQVFFPKMGSQVGKSLCRPYSKQRPLAQAETRPCLERVRRPPQHVSLSCLTSALLLSVSTPCLIVRESNDLQLRSLLFFYDWLISTKKSSPLIPPRKTSASIM